MSSASLQDPQLDLGELPPFPVRRWTLAEYHALIDQGMFDDERVELLEGWIVPKMTRNPLHEATITIVDGALRFLLPLDTLMRIQSAVTIGNSEPEPDLAIVQGLAQDYLHHHPTAGEIHLLVEVADSSLRKDRRKAAIYAAAEVPVYWIINLTERQVEVFESPHPQGRSYEEARVLHPGETLVLKLGEHEISIRVDDLLPHI